MKNNLQNNKITISHGSGGKLMHDLIKNLFLEKFNNPLLSSLADSAIINLNGNLIAFTTDSYVVNPIFFPGGDIGKLAVCGTINDLAVVGANPVYISCALVIEEGFEYELLEKIIDSMRITAEEAGVEIVTGDTKIVERGKGDKIFINTSGIGLIDRGVLSIEDIEVGDKIILSGSIGEHEIAILSGRADLALDVKIESDCAPLNDLIQNVIKASDKIKFMRDPTRGGLATVLNEIVENRNYGIMLEEEKIPVKEEVRAVCEILGFDPLYMANEGKVVIIAGPEDADKIVNIMRRHPLGKDSRIIGEIIPEPTGLVCMRTRSGGTRIVDMLFGEQLPRIC